MKSNPRPVHDCLAECERYCEKSYHLDVPPGAFDNRGVVTHFKNPNDSYMMCRYANRTRGERMLQVTMPKLNDFGDDGAVVEILVDVGDEVTAGEAVVTVEMDKSVLEIESEEDGKVKAIRVKVGDKIEVGQVILELE